MKGKQNRGKRFSFSRCLEWQTNAGEDKARLTGKGKSREREEQKSLPGKYLGVVKRQGPYQSQPSLNMGRFSPFKYFKGMLCCRTAIIRAYPCNPVYLGYPLEPEAHKNFVKVSAVSQVAFIISHMPELLPLQSQTGFELDLLHFSHCIRDQPEDTSLCRACGTHQGSLSAHTALLSQAASLD